MKNDSAPRTRTLRIVIMDDEDWLREAYSIMLRGWYDGAEVLKFDDPRAALQELSRSHTDLFITDIHHSGMSGAEMLEHLAERKVKYPILVISAALSMHGEDERRGWGPGLNVSFLSKPMSAEEFRTAVEAALQIPAR
jgi:FixJ family two-component response regulator